LAALPHPDATPDRDAAGNPDRLPHPLARPAATLAHRDRRVGAAVAVRRSADPGTVCGLGPRAYLRVASWRHAPARSRGVRGAGLDRRVASGALRGRAGRGTHLRVSPVEDAGAVRALR